MKKNYPTHIITHHSNGTLADVCASTAKHDVYIVDGWHKQMWHGFTSLKLRRPDNNELWHVGYHLVTNLDTGETIQTRDFREEGAHCIGMNTSSIGWLFIGNYTKCSADRIDAIMAKREFLNNAPGIMKDFNIPIQNIVPHRHYTGKDCHGDQLPDDYFQHFLREKNEVGFVEAVELREKVVKIEALVQSLQRLVAMLLSFWSKKRLALRENNNAKA